MIQNKILISDNDYSDMKKWMRDYIDNKCIFRQDISNWEIDNRSDKSILPSKKKGDWYAWQFYLRRGCFSSTFNSILTQMFIYQIERKIGHFNFQLSGLETAATPMLSAIPLVARNFGVELNSFVVRKKHKEYGLLNWIEGNIEPNVPIMIIDDLISKSSSMKKCYDILTQFNYKTLNYVFAIINKRTKYSHQWNLNNSMTHCELIPDKKILYLFDCDDFNLYDGSFEG